MVPEVYADQLALCHADGSFKKALPKYKGFAWSSQLLVEVAMTIREMRSQTFPERVAMVCRISHALKKKCHIHTVNIPWRTEEMGTL